jgi:hypothetical protein
LHDSRADFLAGSDGDAVQSLFPRGMPGTMAEREAGVRSM